MYETLQLKIGALGEKPKLRRNSVSFRTQTGEEDQGAQYTLWFRACHGATTMGEQKSTSRGTSGAVPSPSVFFWVFVVKIPPTPFLAELGRLITVAANPDVVCTIQVSNDGRCAAIF